MPARRSGPRSGPAWSGGNVRGVLAWNRAAVSSLSDLRPDVDHIGQISTEENQTLQPVQLAPGHAHRQQNRGEGDHDRKVDLTEAYARQRGDHRGDAQDAKAVEDVGAHNIAQGDVGLLANGGDY